MVIQTQAWKCDLCGYIWLKVAGRNPAQCPNRKCRSRKWNSQAPVKEQPRLIADKPRQPEEARPAYYTPARYR